MHRHIMVVATLVATTGTAHADAPVEVTRTRRPGPIMLDVSVAYGVRAIDGMDSESASGLALGVEVGRRLRPRWGVVAVLEADAMAREDYISYGVWTIGMGVRWDGPVLITVGGGLALGSSKRVAGDFTLEDRSFSGVTALAHGILPLGVIGRAKVGVAGNLSVKAVTEATITTLSAGASVAW